MKKLILPFIALLLIFSGCSNNDSDESVTADSGINRETAEEVVLPLKVGMELAYPPFEMTDTDGNPAGISVDIVKAFGEYLGRPVEIENIAWDGLIPSLKTGKVDMVLSSMTITEERKESVDFSDPYCKSFLTMLIAKDSPVLEFPDLNNPGRVVAVRKGTSAHIYSREHLPKRKSGYLIRKAPVFLKWYRVKQTRFYTISFQISETGKKTEKQPDLILRLFRKILSIGGQHSRRVIMNCANP